MDGPWADYAPAAAPAVTPAQTGGPWEDYAPAAPMGAPPRPAGGFEAQPAPPPPQPPTPSLMGAPPVAAGSFQPQPEAPAPELTAPRQPPLGPTPAEAAKSLADAMNQSSERRRAGTAAIGGALKEGFSSEPLGLKPGSETDKALQGLGITGPNILQQFNEAIIQLGAVPVDAFLRAFPAVLSSLHETVYQTSIGMGAPPADALRHADEVAGMAEMEITRQMGDAGVPRDLPAPTKPSIPVQRFLKDAERYPPNPYSQKPVPPYATDVQAVPRLTGPEGSAPPPAEPPAAGARPAPPPEPPQPGAGEPQAQAPAAPVPPQSEAGVTQPPVPRAAPPEVIVPPPAAEARPGVIAVPPEAGQVGTGERAKPVVAEKPGDVERAPVQPAMPTPAQAEAGNYQLTHAKVQGLPVSIETPAGGVRRGVGVDGQPWQSVSPAAYGYVKGSKGADGDQVDVYVGQNPASDRVFVVDQKDLATGKWDEHKAVLGVTTEAEARALYEAGFSDGRGAQRIGAITEMSMPDFKEWLKSGKTKAPLAETAHVNEPSKSAGPWNDYAPAVPQPLPDRGVFPSGRGAEGQVPQGGADVGLGSVRMPGTRPGQQVAPPAEVRPAPRKRKKSDKAVDVLQFIKGMGGIRPSAQDLAELRAVGAHRIPGLLRTGEGTKGLRPDMMREALAEAGFFHGHGTNEEAIANTTPSDLYDLLDRRINRGERFYSMEDHTAGAVEYSTANQRYEAERFDQAKADVIASRKRALDSDVSAVAHTADDAKNPLPRGAHGVDRNATSVFESEKPIMEVLRGQRNRSLPAMAEQLRNVSAGHGAETDTSTQPGSQGQRQGVQSGQLPVGNHSGAEQEQDIRRDIAQLRRSIQNSQRMGIRGGINAERSLSSARARLADRESTLTAILQGWQSSATTDIQRRNATDHRLGAADRNLGVGSVSAHEVRVERGKSADAIAANHEVIEALKRNDIFSPTDPFIERAAYLLMRGEAETPELAYELAVEQTAAERNTDDDSAFINAQAGEDIIPAWEWSPAESEGAAAAGAPAEGELPEGRPSGGIAGEVSDRSAEGNVAAHGDRLPADREAALATTEGAPDHGAASAEVGKAEPAAVAEAGVARNAEKPVAAEPVSKADKVAVARPEPGAEGKPQGVMFGGETLATPPKKVAKVEQRPADEGLFAKEEKLEGEQLTLASSAPETGPSEAPEPRIRLAPDEREVLQADLKGIISRIAGREIEVRFDDKIDLPQVASITAMQRAAAASGIEMTPTAGGVFQQFVDGREVIRLALNDPNWTNPRNVAGHEAWHAVWPTLTREEQHIFEDDVARGPQSRLRRLVAAEYGMKPDDPYVRDMPHEEIGANAFQRYRRLNEEERGTGIHIALRRAFDRFIHMLREIAAKLRLRGILKPEDIFERARTGKMADRARPDLSETRAATKPKSEVDYTKTPPLRPGTERDTTGHYDLGEFPIVEGRPLGEQAQAAMLELGRRADREFLAVFDQNGTTHAFGWGSKTNTGFPDRLSEALRDPSRSLVVHHNHPESGSFSVADIAHLGFPGAHSVWAYGHDGSVYRSALTKDAKAALPAETNARVSRLLSIIKMVDTVLYEAMYPRIAGILAPRNAVENAALRKIGGKAQGDFTARVLRDSGVIDYTTNVDFSALVERLNLRATMDRLARSVRRELFHDEGRRHVAGQPQPIRHVGELGVVLEKSRLTAPEYRWQGGTAEARSVVRPPEETGSGGGFEAPRGVAARAAQARRQAVLARNFKKFWTSTFQPELVSDKAMEADPLFARYKAAGAQEKDAILHQSEAHWEYWNKQGPAAGIRFMNEVERNLTPTSPREARMAERYRAILDANWAAEKAFGSTASFVEDYFPHIWETPEEWRQLSDRMSKQIGPTWFQKGRTIDYIDEGLRAGLKLRYTNPVDIVTRRLLSGVDMRQRMELLYKLQDMGLALHAAGDEAAHLARREGWSEINAPDRKSWILSPDVQALWKNAVEARGLWQAEHLGGSIFRGWMGFKTAWVPVKLALSMFHPLHVLHIDQANSLARAWTQLSRGQDPLGAVKSAVEGIATLPTLGAIHAVRGGRARAAWKKRPQDQTPEEKAIVALMTDGGFVPQLTEEMKIGAKRTLAVATQNILRGEGGVSDWRKATTSLARRFIEKMQGPIFERWIPSLKAAAYLDEAASLLNRRPDLQNRDIPRRIALRAIAKSIDNRYGEMTYGTLFWNRSLKDSAIASFLSLGWNLGFVREFGGAAFESASRPLGLFPPFKPGGPRRTARAATNKQAFALAYVMTAAIITGMMTYLLSHKKPQDTDFIFARLGGENPDGSPRRITNMFYLREIPMLLKHIQERGGDVVAGTGEMIWNKLMFEPFRELATNRDYYGYNIWDESAPIYKRIWQQLKFLAGGESPMSVSGASRAAQLSGKPFDPKDPSTWMESATAPGVGLSLLGFGPAPSYVEKSAIQNRITYLYDQHVAPGSLPQEAGANLPERMAVRSAVLIALRDGDKAALADAYKKGMDLGMTPRSLRMIGREPTDVYLFSRLPEQDQEAILKQASPEEFQLYWPKASRATKTVIPYRPRL